jgi:hypothetical protein
MVGPFTHGRRCINMTHNELLAKIDSKQEDYYADDQSLNALRAVVELHKPLTLNNVIHCPECQYGSAAGTYPCKTIQAIEKELG